MSFDLFVDAFRSYFHLLYKMKGTLCVCARVYEGCLSCESVTGRFSLDVQLRYYTSRLDLCEPGTKHVYSYVFNALVLAYFQHPLGNRQLKLIALFHS